ncbi:unnamed protein product [Toxocara canis]|uniref:Secreted protein n=1 Tax=Toxocara canis TaxID=6265 RepID=A0A183UHY5_TOXCA|nr:unnamed protein product [Toxocara canis]
MEPHTRCAAIGTLMTFTSVDDNVSVGCIHYMVHLFSSPLNVTFWSVRAVPDLVTVVVSAVRFSCVPFDPLYRRCDTRPEMCIARTLFCDGHDNCGLAADEQAITSVVVIGLLGVVYIWRHRTVQKRKRQSRCLRRMLGMGESDIHEEHDETVALLAWTLSTQWLPYMSRKS